MASAQPRAPGSPGAAHPEVPRGSRGGRRPGTGIGGVAWPLAGRGTGAAAWRRAPRAQLLRKGHPTRLASVSSAVNSRNLSSRLTELP